MSKIENEHDYSNDPTPDQVAEDAVSVVDDCDKAMTQLQGMQEYLGTMRKLVSQKLLIDMLCDTLSDTEIEYIIRGYISRQTKYLAAITTSDYWGNITLHVSSTDVCKWKTEISLNSTYITARGELLHATVSQAVRSWHDERKNKLPALLTNDSKDAEPF